MQKTVINNNFITIKNIQNPSKVENNSNKLVFTSEILQSNNKYKKNINPNDLSSNDSSPNPQNEGIHTIMKQVEMINNQISQTIPKGKESKIPNISQTNITINNFNINQVMNIPSTDKSAHGDTIVPLIGKREKYETEPAQNNNKRISKRKKNAENPPVYENIEINPPKETLKIIRKPMVLQTAFRVLKKHIEKIKNNLIILFRESLENRSNDQYSSNSKNHLIEFKGIKNQDIVIKFNFFMNQNNDKSFPNMLKNESENNLGKSGRSVNHKILINQIDQQQKLEKIEISFLKCLETTFEKITQNAENGIYVYFEDYLKSLKNSILKIISKYGQLERSKVIRTLAHGLVDIRSKFLKEKMNEWEKLTEHLKEFKINGKFYPRSHLQNRVYYEVSEYKVSSAVLKSINTCKNAELIKNKYSINKMLSSGLKPNCNGTQCDCCTKSLKSFCDFKPNQSNWISGCSDKERKIECDDSCGCSENCNNSFLRNKEYQKLEEGVSLRQCWGIDFYSRKNIYHLLTNELNIEQKRLIIDDLVRNLNFQDNEGWNVILSAEKTLRLIQDCFTYLKNSNNNNKEKEIKNITSGGELKEYLTQSFENPEQKILFIEEVNKFIKGVEVLIKQLKIKQLRELIRPYSKGLGVVCINPNGITKNSLIIKYYGEVYPPWYWYLKQDAIKSFLTQLKKGKFKRLSQYKNDYNMEFYNIFLEKHRSEPKGTELLVVDPIMKGNYASRLSHSCAPNCVTVPVISNQQYCIGNKLNLKVCFPRKK